MEFRSLLSKVTDQIVENEISINNIDIGECNFVFGYEKGWLKICCHGGTAYKKFVGNMDLAVRLMMPVLLKRMTEADVIRYCNTVKGFKTWNYYKEFYGKKA